MDSLKKYIKKYSNFTPNWYLLILLFDTYLAHFIIYKMDRSLDTPIPGALKPLQGPQSPPHSCTSSRTPCWEPFTEFSPDSQSIPEAPPSYHPARRAAAGALGGLEDTPVVARMGAGAGEANSALVTGYLTAAGQSGHEWVNEEHLPPALPPRANWPCRGLLTPALWAPPLFPVGHCWSQKAKVSRTGNGRDTQLHQVG